MLYKSERKEILKADFHKWKDIKPDKMEGIDPPPLLKAPITNDTTQLSKDFTSVVQKEKLIDVLNDRKSSRKFKQDALTIVELSFLLYYTQGIKKITDSYTFRTVPSGGIRHPFETYLVISNVTGLKPGIYHYLPESHSVEFLFENPDQFDHIKHAARNQKYVADCPVLFIWSCISYRTEWRYHMSSYKTILLDAGHVCQNLYIASEAIGCGTVAIGNYDQEYLDDYLKIDGENEFVIYLAPVGKI